MFAVEVVLVSKHGYPQMSILHRRLNNTAPFIGGGLALFGKDGLAHRELEFAVGALNIELHTIIE